MMNSNPLAKFFHPAMSSKSLGKKPRALQIGDDKIVLFRDQQGAVVALEDRCPHRFTPLSLGKVHGDKIACPYHGWKMDRDGAVEHPVAGLTKNCSVKSYSTHERHGYVWISANPMAVRPPLASDDWIWLGAYEIEIAAPLHVAFDNFSEDEHFPYVHKVLGWNEGGAHDVDFDFEAGEDELHVHYRGPQRKFPGMSLFMAKPGDYFDNRWVTRFDPIRITYTAAMTNKAGKRSNVLQQRVAVFFTPVGAGRTKLHVIQYAKFDNPKWNFLFKFTAGLTTAITKWDLCFDRDFVEKIGDIPYELKGMRLGKYDQPIFHGRKLMDRIYFGRGAELAQATVPGALASAKVPEITFAQEGDRL